MFEEIELKDAVFGLSKTEPVIPRGDNRNGLAVQLFLGQIVF